MNNYEYIIASLPVMTKNWTPAEGMSSDSLISMIKEQCSKRDNRLIDTLMMGFDEDSLNEEFYKSAISHSNRFINRYFNFDLLLRNTKASFINASLGRPAGTDIFMEAKTDDPDKEKVEAAFQTKDLLDRERAIDELMWQRISEINTFDTFDIEAILGFIAKLHIVDRWLRLDEDSGREMFSKLIKEVRGTFRGVEYAG